MQPTASNHSTPTQLLQKPPKKKTRPSSPWRSNNVPCEPTLVSLIDWWRFLSSWRLTLFNFRFNSMLDFGSTTQYNMNRKTIRFILAVSAEHRRYNNTLYNIFYYIQICGVRTRTELSDSLHRILSEQRPEKTCRKKTSVRKKTRQEIWVGSMAHALKSPSYEGYTAGRTLPLFTKQVFQQRTANSK